MLCHEGISLMLNIFRGKASTPNFRVVTPLDGEIQKITVNLEVIFVLESAQKSQY